MDLRSTVQFKSLPPFRSPIGLPDFVVVTGLNGSGKTHLLEGLGAQTTSSTNPIALYVGEKRLGPLRLAQARLFGITPLYH